MSRPSPMNAMVYRRTGPAAEVLLAEEMACPSPGAGEVLVRLHTSGVNPSDVKNRAGFYGPAMPFPAIVPHSDGAGEIAAVGAGVDAARVGERVWLWNAQFRRPYGTAAEFCCLPAEQAVRLPDGVGFEAGACLGIPAQTAFRAVTLGEDVAGRTVLVSGGAGAVGHYAVQFAKLQGARVIATVSSDRKAEHARAAGADVIVDYTHEDLGEAVAALTDGRGADRVIEVEFGVNFPALTKVLAPHGTVYVYGSAQKLDVAIHVQQLILHNATFHFRSVYLIPLQERLRMLEEMNRHLADGQLRHAVGLVVPLREIARAHEAVASGEVIGNVVVRIAE